jgi:hypothetical protein
LDEVTKKGIGETEKSKDHVGIKTRNQPSRIDFLFSCKLAYIQVNFLTWYPTLWSYKMGNAEIIFHSFCHFSRLILLVEERISLVPWQAAIFQPAV